MLNLEQLEPRNLPSTLGISLVDALAYGNLPGLQVVQVAPQSHAAPQVTQHAAQPQGQPQSHAPQHHTVPKPHDPVPPVLVTDAPGGSNHYFIRTPDNPYSYADEGSGCDAHTVQIVDLITGQTVSTTSYSGATLSIDMTSLFPTTSQPVPTGPNPSGQAWWDNYQVTVTGLASGSVVYVDSLALLYQPS